MKLKVHSLRIEHIRTYNNRDDDFEDNSKYILNCISENNLKYEVSLWTEYGDCPSGWCSASWGHCEVKLVDSFIGSTHKPIKDLSFEIGTVEGDFEDTIYSAENDIFHVDIQMAMLELQKNYLQKQIVQWIKDLFGFSKVIVD